MRPTNDVQWWLLVRWLVWWVKKSNKHEEDRSGGGGTAKESLRSSSLRHLMKPELSAATVASTLSQVHVANKFLR